MGGGLDGEALDGNNIYDRGRAVLAGHREVDSGEGAQLGRGAMISLDRFFKVLLVAGALVFAGPAAAGAATFTVNTKLDNASAPSASLKTCPSKCTLRDAMIVAGNTAGTSTIKLPAGHYSLTLAPTGTDDGTTGDLHFNGGTLKIVGANAATTTIDAKGLGDRVLDLTSGGSLALSHLTLTGGLVSNSLGGGGIHVAGPAHLTLSHVAVVRNTATQAGYGGGMYVGSGATVSIDHSLFAYNKNSGDGGAIDTHGTLSITDSTLADNHVDTSLYPTSSDWGAYGGAMEVDGSTATVHLSNVTIAGNTIHGTNSTAGNGGSGSAIDGGGPNVTGVNVIIYGNTASGTAASGDCDTPFTSNGHNVDQDGSCFTGGVGDTTANPRLGTLAHNGGETATMAIGVAGSAYNKGSNAACPATDQRGVKRPVKAICDIGAFELDPPANRAVPKITGTPHPHHKLSCSKGAWTGSPFRSYRYQWKRNGTVIKHAMSRTYRVTSADVGRHLKCAVTASTPGDGSARATSAAVKVPGTHHHHHHHHH